ncbi:hypothetical protein [Endozoicomonas sp.]|uniref:LPS-assembly lipoprotein LptE n=1 Tax=Endozoicomonas sp. TaxID=1892382 RepID=UPI00383BC448
MTYTLRSVSMLTLLLLTCLLTACGFQLRGQMETASELKQLAVSGSDPVYIRYLSRAMERSGIEISAQAPYRINIIRVERDADQQTAATAGYFEQRISMTVAYQLQTSSGLSLFAPVELTRERYITQNQDTPNASESEQTIIRSELRQELIATTLRRIHSLSESALAEESEKARAIKKSSMESTRDRDSQP